MCDDVIHQGLVAHELRPLRPQGLSRRSFGLSLAAAAGTPASVVAAGTVVETDVAVTTPDGACDAVLFHPAGDTKHPAVLIWPDILGLRPVFRAMGRRLASQGYVVLVPNPFYRSKRAPVTDATFDFNNPAQRQILFGYRGAISPAGAAHDASAYLGFLDAQAQTDTTAKAGVQGYCMGGELSFRTAAAVPSRVAAVASFHGGNGLATDTPDSPHLLIPRTNATFLVCQARNDDAQKPQVKQTLRSAFQAAGRNATVEVYNADHGWCVQGGKAYDAAEAERAWLALTALYKTALA
jgi:carboxymethylenebutenolidase